MGIINHEIGEKHEKMEGDQTDEKALNPEL